MFFLNKTILLYFKALLIVLVFGFAEFIYSCLRIKYLKACQKRIKIDYHTEITLRNAWWSYFYQVVGLAFSIYFLVPVYFEKTAIIVKIIFITISMLLLMMTVVTLARRLKSRVVVGAGRQLLYFDGYRNEIIYSGQISKYNYSYYNFNITKNDNNKLKIPTTFRCSEIIMRVLEDAIADNSRKEGKRDADQ